MCYGHNHVFKVERIGSTLTINPGTVMGYSPLTKQDVAATFVIYDTVADSAQGFQIVSAGQGETSREILPYATAFQARLLPEKYDYLAPDFSEVRLLAGVNGGA
ncbi:MAG TPA: metallophosphoesterase family protein [Herpetosiphonaceae bacterium]